MPDEVIIEELPAHDANPAPQLAAEPPATPKAAAPAPEEKPKPDDTVAQVQAQKPAEIQKSNVGGLLDKLISIGGHSGVIAQQLKTLLKPPAIEPAPAAVKPVEPADLAKLVAGEVAKQLEAALKAVPTLRKGLVQPDSEAEELRKQFDSLPPEKKLRAVLAVRESK